MQPTLLFMGIGAQEIVLIALVILLFFGGKKIPEMMRGLGRGVKSFKDGMNEKENIMKDITAEEKTPKEGEVPKEQDK